MRDGEFQSAENSGNSTEAERRRTKVQSGNFGVQDDPAHLGGGREDRDRIGE